MTTWTVKTTNEVLYEGTSYEVAVNILLANEDAVMLAHPWTITPSKTWCEA